MTAAIAKAQASGIGMVTVHNARHFGANGYFAELAARAGMVAMVSANNPVSGIPPRALRPVVGPNPFAFAAPTGAGTPPLVFDISMTAASGSKVNRAHLAGKPVPLGWVVDADGVPTTDAAASRNGGGMELLGGQVAGHKGYALALMVDTLGIMSGNGSGLWQSGLTAETRTPSAPSTWTQGQWFAAWRPDLFIDTDEFTAHLRQLADDVHEVPTRDGGHVLLPGERRAACRADRLANGIPLSEEVVAPLRALAEQAGVPFPEPIPSQPEPIQETRQTPGSRNNRRAT
jgi:LDH2 family malate/lactate/ureidoglycolate dehydrogenase